jgi:hypothetical protein
MIINDVPQIVKEKKLTFFAFLTFFADAIYSVHFL